MSRLQKTRARDKTPDMRKPLRSLFVLPLVASVAGMLLGACVEQDDEKPNDEDLKVAKQNILTTAPTPKYAVNADLDGKQLPPAGAPNILMAAGGAQLKGIVRDDGIYWWKFHVDWKDPTKSRLDGPQKIPAEVVKTLAMPQP